MITPTLHVGFENYVLTEQVLAILDSTSRTIKKFIRDTRKERPRAILDITDGKAALTLICLTGDRYILSPVHRQWIVGRVVHIEYVPTRRIPKNKPGPKRKTRTVLKVTDSPEVHDSGTEETEE